MSNLRKLGGIAALIEAITYLVGFGVGFTLLADYLAGDITRSETVAYLADKESILYVWNLIIYVINGVFLVVLAIGLYDLLHDETPAIAQIAAAFGLIWAGLVIASGMLILVDLGTLVDLYEKNPVEAELAWETLSSIEEGLGGGIEVVGGIWVLLISWAAISSDRLPKPLNYLGFIVGIAGILTIVPPLAEGFAAIFGLGCIVWFIWTGVVMLRSSANPA